MTIPLDTPPGTEVVCIGLGRPRPADCPTRLVLGQVYTVGEWDTEVMSGRPLVLLDENYDPEWGWEPECFRLLDLSAFDALLECEVTA